MTFDHSSTLWNDDVQRTSNPSGSGSNEGQRSSDVIEDPPLEGEEEEVEEDVDDFIADRSESIKYARERLFGAFLIFGLLNNVLYVIILSAAIDLVPSTTPKGIVAFFNILPAVLAKVLWPLVSNGAVRYTKRVGFCTITSWFGIIIVAFSSTLYPRLFGISLASLSSGLGELTFLQLSTTLPTRRSSRSALGAWSSGTGAAGIAGAAIWWLLRGLGVKGGLGISSFLPLLFPAVYTWLLPPWSSLKEDSTSSATYQPISSDPLLTDSRIINGGENHNQSLSDTRVSNGSNSQLSKDGSGLRLSTTEKIDLLRPLLIRYMLPLCLVYIAEYIINSGVAPTLVFPIPTEGIWSHLFKSPRDYYPFWSLTYQTSVFISRSSLALGIPPLPRRFLPAPTIIQCVNLIILALQASFFILSPSAYTPPATPPTSGSDSTITRVFLLICLEGLCGGSAYVNTFYHVGREGESTNAAGGDEDEGAEDPILKMQREFRIGATGAADSTGILVASLISMPLEMGLCNAQVNRGRTTCRDL